MQDAVAQLDEERGKAAEETSRLSAELAASKTAAAELTAQLNETTAAKEELAATLKVVNAEHSQKVAGFEEQVNTLVSDLESVTSKYESASEEQQRLVDEVLALEESLAIEQNHAEKLEFELTTALGA